MSTAALTKATKQLARENDAKKRRKYEGKLAMAQGLQGGGVVVGSVSAGLVDAKFGEGNEPADIKGFPTNAGTGALLLAAGIGAAAMKAPNAGAFLGGTGLGFLGAASYRYIVDNVEFD